MDLFHGVAPKDAPSPSAHRAESSAPAPHGPQTVGLRFSHEFLSSGSGSNERASQGVVYARERDGDIIGFTHSANGEKLLAEYRDGVGRLEAKLTTGLPNADPQAARIKQRLNVFSDRLSQGAGPGSYFSTELGLLYGYGKHAFDRITAALDDPAAAKNLHGELTNLTEGLTVCASGVASNIAGTAERLESAGPGLRQAARRWREQNVEAIIMQFVRTHHHTEPLYTNNEIHYANAYRNALAAEWHLQPRTDHVVPHTVTDNRIANVRSHLRGLVTPQEFIDNAVHEFSNAIAQHFPPGRVFYVDELDKPLLEAFEDATASGVGNLTMPDVFEEYGENAAGFPGYRQRLDGFPLERAVTRNLRDAGIVETISRTTLCRDDETGLALKLIGGSPYMKDFRSGSRRRFVPEDFNLAFIRRSGSSALLTFAIGAENDAALADLLARGADPAHCDDHGVTPLHTAARGGTRRAVEILLQANADVNAADHAGQTPLLLAAFRGDRSITQLLLRANAKADAAGLADDTPLSMALKCGHDEIAADLIAECREQCSGPRGSTLLNIALTNCKAETVAHLLAVGADPRSPDMVGVIPLARAVARNEPAFVTMLLENGADIDGEIPGAKTALNLAFHLEKPAIAMQLLRYGSNIEATDLNGRTALILAAHSGNEEMVRALLAAGARIDHQDASGKTALMCAAGRGYGAAVDVLLRAGAQVAITARRTESALDYAAIAGDPTIVRALLAKHVEQGANLAIHRPFLIAAKNGHAAAAESFIRAGADVSWRDRHNKSALDYAAENGHAAIIQLLAAEARANLADAEGGYAITAAAERGHVAALQELLTHLPGDPEIRGKKLSDAVLEAARSRKPEAVRLLIENGANPNALDEFGQTAVHLAAINGQSDLLSFLIRNGAHTDALDRRERSALTFASEAGHADAVSVLLDHGANIDAASDDPPLLAAAQNGHLPIVRILHKAGGDIAGTDAVGRSALCLAVSHGHEDIVRYLLENAAPAGQLDYTGNSVLHRAASNDKPQILQILLKKNPQQIDLQSFAHGRSAVHEAARFGRVENIRLLAEAGADLSLVDHQNRTPVQIAQRAQQLAAAQELIRRGAAERPELRRSDRKRARPE